MLYKVGANTELWATPFFSLKGLLLLPSLIERTKDLVCRSSMIKLVNSHVLAEDAFYQL